MTAATTHSRPPGRITTPSRRDPGAAGLGALLFGLLVAPWVYAALGALSAFSPSFAVVATLLLIVATVDLAVEAFVRPRGFNRGRAVGAALSAFLLVAILSVLTDFTLLTTRERIGLLATIWLGAAVVWLIISLPLREVGPEVILRQCLDSPSLRRWALTLATLLYLALAFLAWRHLTTPPVFIGSWPG